MGGEIVNTLQRPYLVFGGDRGRGNPVRGEDQPFTR